MKKYYIVADVSRNPSAAEASEICVPGARVFCGRVKAVAEAEAWQDAFADGKKAIMESLTPDQTACNFGWMPVDDAEKMGDAEIYARCKTVGGAEKEGKNE